MLTSVRLLWLSRNKVKLLPAAHYLLHQKWSSLGSYSISAAGASCHTQLVWSLCVGCCHRTGSPSPSGALLKLGESNMDIEMKAWTSLPFHLPSKKTWTAKSLHSAPLTGSLYKQKFLYTHKVSVYTQSFCKTLFSAAEGSDTCLLCFTGVWCQVMNHQVQKCAWAAWTTFCLT